MSEEERKNKQPNLKPVLIIIAILLAIIAFCMCLIGYKVYDDLSRQKKAEATNMYSVSLADREIALAKDTLYENGIVSEIFNNISLNNPPKWEFFITNTGKYVVQVEGFIDDVERFKAAITSPRASLRYNPIYEYQNEDIDAVRYRAQFVKQLGRDNKSKYNNYELSYSEFSLNSNVNGELNKQEVNGYGEGMLDLFEAYLQDSDL